jgi:hypothetical protein
MFGKINQNSFSKKLYEKELQKIKDIFKKYCPTDFYVLEADDTGVIDYCQTEVSNTNLTQQNISNNSESNNSNNPFEVLFNGFKKIAEKTNYSELLKLKDIIEDPKNLEKDCKMSKNQGVLIIFDISKKNTSKIGVWLSEKLISDNNFDLSQIEFCSKAKKLDIEKIPDEYFMIFIYDNQIFYSDIKTDCLGCAGQNARPVYKKGDIDYKTGAEITYSNQKENVLCVQRNIFIFNKDNGILLYDAPHLNFYLQHFKEADNEFKEKYNAIIQKFIEG